MDVVSSLANLAWDIVERKRTEGELIKSEDFIDTLIDTANAMIVGLDNDGKVTIFNKAAEKITGYKKADLIGVNWFELVSPRSKYPEVWEEFERIIKGGIPKNFENPILTIDAKEKYIVWQNNEIREHDEITGLISFGIDITDRKKAEDELQQHKDHLEALVQERTAELERLAITDYLTGIANRRYGIELIEKVLLDSDRYGDDVSFYLFDIDYFKQVNDNFGHLCGDDALVAVTKVASDALRKNDIICRYGGEEFLICLPRTKLKDAVFVADRIKKAINSTIIECTGKALTVSGGIIERKPE